jgi:hypothetical protein
MPVISVILAIHCRGCIQYSHFCVYDYLFLLQANFKTGQIVADQLFSSATPTQAAVDLAKEDYKVLQLREALMSIGLGDGEKVISDNHGVFESECCGKEANMFPHAEKSKGHLAAQLMAGNKVAKDLHYLMCEYSYDILPL